MKNKCTVIQIDGFRGLLIVGFLIACALAGFIVFPAWCCQQGWNFIAGFVSGMPIMELKHGALLWVIIALISYVTLFGKLRVSFVSAKDDTIHKGYMADSQMLEELEKKIRERLETSESNQNEELKK